MFPIDIFAQQNPAQGCVEIYMITRNKEQRLMIAEFSEVDLDPSCRPGVPTFQLDNSDAQQLMQQLWNAGFRPNNGEGASAQVEAIKAHLEDMRRLVPGLISNPEGC